MLNAKQKIKIYVLVFCLLTIILAIFVIKPLVQNIVKISDTLAKQKEDIALVQKQIDILARFQKNKNEYEQNLQKIGAGFVSEKAPVDFIEFLEQEAQKQNIQIAIVSIQHPNDKNTPQNTMLFQITLAGSFPHCFAFLRRLEQSPWLVRIDNLNIKRAKDKEKIADFEELKEGEVILSLNFKTYSSYLPSLIK
jgi:Tfp pilus assembly protein PilO